MYKILKHGTCNVIYILFNLIKPHIFIGIIHLSLDCKKKSNFVIVFHSCVQIVDVFFYTIWIDRSLRNFCKLICCQQNQ